MKKNIDTYITVAHLVPTPCEVAFQNSYLNKNLHFYGTKEERKAARAAYAKMNEFGRPPYVVSSSQGSLPSHVTPDSARARLLVAMLKHPGLSYADYIKMTGYSGMQSEFRTALKYFGYTQKIGTKAFLTEAGKALAAVLEDRGTKILD